MNPDLQDKNISELHELIVALKTKHYFQERLTLAERKQYRAAKALFAQKWQHLPRATPVGSSSDISVDDLT